MMDIEQRLDRIEHFTAGFAEERRKEREEDRQLWRDTQRQIDSTQRQLDALALRVAETNMSITRLGDEMREADRRLEARIDQLAKESREGDARLGERIEALVGAIGKLLERPS